jgi:hypothetical protein
MRTGEIKFQKAVLARGFQGPRQQPLCRLTDGQIRDEDRRLQSADAKACDRHLAHLHRHHGPGAKVDKRFARQSNRGGGFRQIGVCDG